MALIEYVILLATREGVYWIVGDSAAAVQALRKYQVGYCWVTECESSTPSGWTPNK